jgi:hypothetical protein
MPGIQISTTRSGGRSIARAVMAAPGVTIADAVAGARRELGTRHGIPLKPTFSYRTAASLVAG